MIPFNQCDQCDNVIECCVVLLIENLNILLMPFNPPLTQAFFFFLMCKPNHRWDCTLWVLF